MKRTWTIIGVADVARSFRWFRALLGEPPGDPAHDCRFRAPLTMIPVRTEHAAGSEQGTGVAHDTGPSISGTH